VRTAAPTGRPALRGCVVLAVCLLASGCHSSVSRNLADPEAARADGWARVENVPEVRQSGREDCGAAALAMVLGHWGRRVTPGEIWAASPPSQGRGLRADALRDFARREGLQAFLVEGQPADLDRELGRDRPVLVGVVKRKGRRAYPHYEVVVGINRKRQRILTLDPARGARENSLKRFTEEWAAAGRLTLVVFPSTPAPLPVAREVP
jgi:ABC-type bacteriocin/lantibiotic exporter with double-glycine peptidase domain